MDERAIAERRRRRRAAESRRRVRARRRRALIGLAGLAFLGGIAIGASGPAPPVTATAAPEERGEGKSSPPAVPVPTVTGFADAVPVLMYHAIADPSADAGFPELFVSRDDFRDQMKALAAAGFHAVTLRELRAAWDEGAPIAANPVVVSFDDGLRSQYAEGLRTLRRQAWPAVLNLKTDALEQGELSDAMVREMLDQGWELAAHTMTHPDLTKLDERALRREVAGSRRALQRRFDVPVEFFCYPGGRYNDTVLAAVRDAGYAGATTTAPGLASPRSDPFQLERIRVDRSDGVAGLIAKLKAAGAAL